MNNSWVASGVPEDTNAAECWDSRCREREQCPSGLVRSRRGHGVDQCGIMMCWSKVGVGSIDVEVDQVWEVDVVSIR